MITQDIIRKLCKEKGISVTDLEKSLGFGNGSLTKSSSNAIRSDRLLLISKYFNVSMEYLLGEQLTSPVYNADVLLLIDAYSKLSQNHKKIVTEIIESFLNMEKNS